MRTALITVAHGRHDHLRLQQRMLERAGRQPDLRIVVAMDDPEVARLVGSAVVVIEMASGTADLPVAAARNAGARAALEAGAELLIFLDVDCLPAVDMVGSYQRACSGPAAGSLLCGPVAYLPVAPAGGYDLDRLDTHPFHPARPAPEPGVVLSGGDHRLFWSLSFALSAQTWQRIGGFCERYVGYGAEDTDFAMLARDAGVDLSWVGGAAAFHQWHPSGTPPLRHVDDILRNGAIFAERWGWWPMEGWLAQFAELGLITWVDDTTGWKRVPGSVRNAQGGLSNRSALRRTSGGRYL